MAVGDELGDRVRPDRAVLQFVVRSPPGAEVPPVPRVFGPGGHQAFAQLAPRRGVEGGAAGDQPQHAGFVVAVQEKGERVLHRAGDTADHRFGRHLGTLWTVGIRGLPYSP
jgi:hypothetical protein